MTREEETKTCSFCGYTADGKFEGDICPQCNLTYWKCSHCGFTITTVAPPDVCPECGEKCEFIKITCYTPECGGPGNIDPRVKNHDILTENPFVILTTKGYSCACEKSANWVVNWAVEGLFTCT